MPVNQPPRARKKRRRPLRTLLILLLVMAGLALFLYDQNNRLSWENIGVSDTRIPAAFDNYRIVLLSDGHGKEFGKDNAVLLQKVASLKPDIIVYAGDLIDEITQFETVPALAKGLSAIAPTYYVTGNHEWAVRHVPELEAMLTGNGVTVLKNTYVPLKRGGETIVLAGVNDPNGPYDQKSPERLAAEIRQTYKDNFVMLLAHRNNLFARYAACGYDLMLSGHGHGGVIRLPFTDGLIGTEHNLFPTWTAGLYTLGDGQLVVSRGLGNEKPSFRIFNRPDIVLVVLHPEA